MSPPTSTATATPISSSRPRPATSCSGTTATAPSPRAPRAAGRRRLVRAGTPAQRSPTSTATAGRTSSSPATRTCIDPITSSISGFPTNYQGVRDELFLNEGNDKNGHAHFREVGRAGRARPGAVRPQPRRGLHRRQRRRPPGSLRRERRGSEQALHQRADRRRREGGSAGLGFRFVQPGERRRRDEQERRHGRRGRGLQRRRPHRPLHHELAAPAPRGVRGTPGGRGPRSLVREHAIRLQHRPRRPQHRRLGRLVGRPHEQR